MPRIPRLTLEAAAALLAELGFATTTSTNAVRAVRGDTVLRLSFHPRGVYAQEGEGRTPLRFGVYATADQLRTFAQPAPEVYHDGAEAFVLLPAVA